MNILIVSGFLGAGKTTFIKYLAQKTNKFFCILENEYAQESVDTAILQNEDLSVYELTEGCVCCSAKDDLASSVLTIANTVDPDYLVIEPTGVAFLSNMMENLKKVEYERITILSPVAIISAPSNLGFWDENSDFTFETSAATKELLTDQIKNAKTIIISKCEKYSEDELAPFVKNLHTINNNAFIPKIHYTKCDDSVFDSILQTKYDGSVITKNESENENYDTYSLIDTKFDKIGLVIMFLENLIRGEFGDIIRAKGVLEISENEKVRFDAVGENYCIESLEKDDDSEKKAVFIGNNLKKSKILKAMKKAKPSAK